MTSPGARRSGDARPVVGGAFVAVGLLAVLVVWFGRACWGGWWIVDRWSQSDTYMLGSLYARWAAQVKGGHLPLWFPEFGAGSPVHAAWMYGLFYPPLALFLVMPTEAAWTWLAILHVVFGGVGMYALVWRARRDVAAAACGAVVFALSGFFLVRVLCGHLNLVMPFAWAPWTLLAALRVVDGASGATAWLGICAGLGLLAGHVQIWFYVAPLVAAAALFETSRRRAWGTAVPRLAAGAALALGIATIQWAPAWELFAVSGHPPEARSAVESCSAPLSALAAQIAPRFAASNERFANEFSGLAGPLAVGAALLALRPRDGRRRFWFLVLALGLVMATGLRTAAGSLACEVPPFCWARTPARATTLVVIAGAVLAADAVADFLGRAPAAVRALAPVAFAASALVFGPPAPDVVRADFFDYAWSRALAAYDGRVVVNAVRHPFVEADGVRTLREVCPYDTPGARALLDAATPIPVQAWWFDVAAVVEPPWTDPPDGAAAVSDAASRARATPSPHGGAAQFFARAQRAASDDEVLARLRAGDRSLWVEGATPDAASSSPHSVTRVPTSSPTEISFDVEPRDGGELLVSEKWYPGWMDRRADGSWTPVARGNLAFIAVPAADAGRIAYRPWWLWPSIAVSLAVLLAAVVIVVRRRDAR